MRIVSPIIVGILVIVVGVVLARPRYPIRVKQPTEFDHKKHVEHTSGMECVDCHKYYQEYAVAGMPDVAVCIECHEEDMDKGDKELEKTPDKLVLKDYYEGGKEFDWVRMYTQPEHVYFSHSMHFNRRKLDELLDEGKLEEDSQGREPPGVVTCDKCHGETGASETPVKTRDLTMKTCMDCHEKEGATLDCLGCHK